MAKSNIHLKIAGTAMWAKVFEPDTKFNPDGDYSNQHPDASQAEAAPRNE